MNYLQKGCFNQPKHPIFTLALLWSSLSMHAEFQADRFHSFGVMEETHALTSAHALARMHTHGHTQTYRSVSRIFKGVVGV